KNLREIRNTLDEQQAQMPHLKSSKQPVFELNRTNAYGPNNPIPKTEDLPDGLVYKVQVGVFSNEKSPSYFNGLYPLTEHVISEGVYEYDAGIFYSYEQALEAKKQIQQKGFKDAFIVAFYNKKPISVSQALRLEKQQ
ncbi:MAG: SPOR domain-containing protein, partial [Bacteroidetes bacterium]